MPQRLGSAGRVRLERSCKRRTDSIRFATGAAGVELLEAKLYSSAYEPHRHDTYAIGITTAGVQTFQYRGSRRVCMPGQLHILHPDESHDGAAATDAGFGYRILYITPQLVREALGQRALPFIADPVQEQRPATQAISDFLLSDLDEPISELTCTDVAVAVADGLLSLSGHESSRQPSIDLRAVELVRDYLESHARDHTSAVALETLAGTDRFTIARHFRWAFGTSPDRYRIRRRLELARVAIENGQPLAQAAVDAGFSDQSHMTRQFKQTYGLTPGRWLALTIGSN